MGGRGGDSGYKGSSIPEQFYSNGNKSIDDAISYAKGMDGYNSQTAKVFTTLSDTIERLKADGHEVEVEYVDFQNGETASGGYGVGILAAQKEGGTIRAILPDMSKTTDDFKPRAASVMAHELTHLRDLAMAKGHKLGDLTRAEQMLQSKIPSISVDDVPKFVKDSFKHASDEFKAKEKTSKDTFALIDRITGKQRGGDQIHDVYDALTGGKYVNYQSKQSKGAIEWGHGTGYYISKGNRAKELIANYSSLKMFRPDLVRQLRKDQPSLCKSLDQVMRELYG